MKSLKIFLLEKINSKDLLNIDILLYTKKINNKVLIESLVKRNGIELLSIVLVCFKRIKYFYFIFVNFSSKKEMIIFTRKKIY